MRREKWRSASLCLVLAALLSVPALAAGPSEGWRGSGGWGAGGSYQRMYNPSTVETVSGVVESVDKIMPAKGMSYGVHIRLKTGKETIPVHLGPAWYLERQDTRIKKGDSVEVKGSRVNYEGKPAIIAAEVKKEGAVLKLRDENGYPAWAGWRR